MKRKVRRSGTNILSLDSLIDVFMNILGILIISAIAISLSPQKDPSTNLKQKASDAVKIKSSKTEKSATVYLPSQETVETIPLYIYIDGDGAKPIDVLGSRPLEDFFSVEYEGDSRKLTPLNGKSLSIKGLRELFQGISGFERHIVVLMNPVGVRYYKSVRTVASNLGIKSGWIPFNENPIIIGPGGRSMNTVQ